MTFEMVFAIGLMLAVLAILLIGTLWSEKRSKRDL